MYKNVFSLSIFFFFYTISLQAQYTPKTKGISSFARFNKTETYFVLTGRKELDDAIIISVKENWTINKAHFIDMDSFAIYSKDRDKSFVYIHKMKKMGVAKKVKVMALVNGGYDNLTDYLSNTLAYIAIDNEGYEANETDFVFRLDNIIHQLEDIVNIIKEYNIIEKNESKVRDKMIRVYNSRCSILKEKTLLIDKRYLNQKIFSEKEFKKLYKYNVEFVSKDFIIKAIAEKKTSYAYLISALNLYKNSYITDCETGNIIYADFEEEDTFRHDFNKNFIDDDISNLSGHVKSGK